MTTTLNTIYDWVAIRREASKLEDAAYLAENLVRSLLYLNPEDMQAAIDNTHGDTPDAAEMVTRLADALFALTRRDGDAQMIANALPLMCGRCRTQMRTTTENSDTPNRCRCGTA